MVECPRCKNRPNECYRSRWYKQLLYLPSLRYRWRCMRCGTTFCAWVWLPEPQNQPFHQTAGPHAVEIAREQGDQVSGDFSAEEGSDGVATLQ